MIRQFLDIFLSPLAATQTKDGVKPVRPPPLLFCCSFQWAQCLLVPQQTGIL